MSEVDGDASVAPPLSLDPAVLGALDGVVDPHTVALAAVVVRRLKRAVADAFLVPFDQLHPAGVLASRLRRPSSHSSSSRGADVGYWNPHVDKANRCLYDFSAVLWLNTYGVDFRGGRFVFLDGASDSASDSGGNAAAAEKSHSCGSDADAQAEPSMMKPLPWGGSSVQSRAVEPRTGRFVAFTSGYENTHHVICHTSILMRRVSCGR